MTDREPAAAPERQKTLSDHERPWLAHYPAGTPHAIDLTGVGTLVALFDGAVDRFGPRQAFRSFGKSLTFAQTGERANAVAAFLQSRGLGRGDRVAIMAPNVMAYPVILFGILKAGCTVVNVNPLYTPREFAAQIRDSGARALFVLENFAHTVEASGEAASLDPLVIVKPGDLLGLKGAVINFVSRHMRKAVPAFALPKAVAFSQALARPGAGAFAPVAVDREEIAFLQYTGGTTGAAKGAMLLHRNVAANVAQLDAWMGRIIESRDDNVMITALPLYHIFSLTACLLFFHLGAAQTLIANPRDIAGFVETLKGEKFTCTVGVNTLYNALANHPAIGEVDFSRVTLCVSGGMATQQAVAARWKKLTGRPIIEGYGLSETSPVVCANPLDLAEFSGTIGYPIPSTEVSVRDIEGRPLPAGAEGELCVRGPQVMAGYWNKPDETARAMTADGFFRTGDMAVMLEDGQFRIVDRIKDVVIVSGFNVYPNEIEDVLALHPKVQEAAVIGVPDGHSGEAVAAFIVKKDASLTAEEIREHCRANLAPYKRPRRIEFRESLPKTNVGKMLRRELRAEVLAEGPPQA